jgi:hypothetical protein
MKKRKLKSLLSLFWLFLSFASSVIYFLFENNVMDNSMIFHVVLYIRSFDYLGLATMLWNICLLKFSFLDVKINVNKISYLFIFIQTNKSLKFFSFNTEKKIINTHMSRRRIVATRNSFLIYLEIGRYTSMWINHKYIYVLFVNDLS